MYNIDIRVQDYVFDFENEYWLLDRHNVLTDVLFYSGIKKLFYIFIILLVFTLTIFHKHPLVRQYKPGLIIVLISTLLVPAVVGSLKSITNIPCPKDIIHYGGSSPHATVLKGYPKKYIQNTRAKCFPAAHASGGFSLLSLFFLFKKKRNKIVAIYFSLAIGWSTGLYKMLIGDHFLSHTLVSMFLAWFIILVIAKVVLAYTSNNLSSPEV